VANYSVDIEVAIKGGQKINEFTRSLNRLNREITVINGRAKQLEGVFRVASMQNYAIAVGKAESALRRAAEGTAQESRAVKALVTAMELENKARARKNFLIAQEVANRRKIIETSDAYKTAIGPQAAPVPFARGPASPIRGTATMPGSPAALAAAAGGGAALRGGAGRFGAAASSALIGGAFPLLFGQGAGAAAGGFIGGAAGGLLGGQAGFALSLVGTLLGDIASRGQKVKELAADIGFSAQQTKMLSDAFKTANTDIEKFTGVIQNVRGLGLAIEDQGRAIQLITTLTDKYGGSFEKVGNAITSALESGKVSQATLNQLTSQGINIQGALADKYKVSRDAILKMAKDGEISVQSLIDTLVDMGNTGESAADRQRSAMDNLRNSVEKLVAATTQAIKSIGQTLGPVFDWLKGRVEDFINALSRAISRLADLISGGKMMQATIRAETAAQQATTNKFGILGGIRAINPAAEAFFQAEKERQLKLTAPGAFPKAVTTPLQTFRVPAQAAASGGGGGTTAKKEKEIKDITAQELNLRLQLLQAQAAQNKELEAFYQRQLSLLEINQRKIGQNEREAQIFEVMVRYTQTMRDLERQRSEEIATKTLESVAKLSEGYTANINALKELNNQQLQQQNLAEGIAGTLGQTMTSAFEALVIGAESFNASLRGIASGVLIEIANQLLRIYIIEQAISTLRTFLSPISGGGIPGYGQGAVATGAFGVSSGGFGGPSVAGIPLGPFAGGTFGVRAAGGPVSAGSPYLVGERGPELFMPRTSGSIYPNDALGAGGVQVGAVNITVQNTGENLSPAAQKQIASQVQGIVMATLVNQKRSGGIL
jgi:tape measure domain-containing protein